MNVLSLFDGMSCGRIALDRLGIKVDNYYASEIDKYAMKVSEENYPDIIQVGDVTELDTSTLPNIDLVMGGSPCQGFSFAGKQLAFDDPRSALFFEFVRCVKELKPKYFLLENVRMKKEYLDIITEQMGVEPIMINSALVSAQNRVRYYWTNILGVEQPKQRGIVLRDILETNTSNEYLAGENLQKNYKGGNQLNPNYKSQANTIHDFNGKSGTICAGTHGYANGYVADVDPKYYLSEKAIAYMNRGSEKYTGKKTRAEHYIKHESKKSNALTANMHKGVPYGVIAIDKPVQEKDKEVYWRKLTPIECERLQTVPDDYTNHVSNTQRYKMLGNGWTIEVIAHILQNMEINHREC
jgi:DNA (cytosine-5)-methyltransferase 3A